MKKKIFWLGVLAITLVLGMTAVSCSDSDSGGGGSRLVGKWYDSELYKEYMPSYYYYEFKKDGTGTAGYGGASFKWTATSDTLTILYIGGEIIFDYTISGDKLTLTRVSGSSSLSDGTFYK